MAAEAVSAWLFPIREGVATQGGVTGLQWGAASSMSTKNRNCTRTPGLEECYHTPCGLLASCQMATLGEGLAAQETQGATDKILLAFTLGPESRPFALGNVKITFMFFK